MSRPDHMRSSDTEKSEAGDRADPGGGPAALASDPRYLELKAARRAALNLAEEAIAARNAAEKLSADLRENEALFRGQMEAFQAAMVGESLETSLGVLVRTAVGHFKDVTARGAFYLSYDGGKTLTHLVGMSDEYATDVDGFKIGEDSLACGLAVAMREPVCTPDVRTDPRWESWRSVANRHGFRACWSFPVQTAGNAPLGTFALYFSEPREPTPRDYELAGVITHAATIIISRHLEATERSRAEKALKDNQAMLQRALSIETVGVLFFSLDGEIQHANDAFVRMSGYSREELSSGLDWNPLTAPEFAEITAASVARLAEVGETPPFEKQMVRKDGSRWWGLFAPTRISGEGQSSRCVEFIVDISDRKIAEDALRESESKYRTLFNSIDAGFCIIEVIFDDDQHAVDYRFIETNPAFEDQSGMRDVIGRRMLEFVDNIEEHWLANYGRVALTGEPMRFANEYSGLDRWFEVFAFRTGDDGRNRIGVLFTDITDRQRAVTELRESEERKEFLLRLSDALRPLADADEIKSTALNMLGEQLEVNRAFYADVHNDAWHVTRGYEQGVDPLPDGAYSASTYGPWIMDTYRAGRNVVFRNTATDEGFTQAEREAHAKIGVHAAVGIPLVKRGELGAILAVHSVVPRDWTDQEITILEEVAERTWAAVERARAEAEAREFDVRLRIAADAAGLGVWEWNLVTNKVAWNHHHYRLLGLDPGEGEIAVTEFFEYVYADDREPLEEQLRHSVAEDLPFDAVFRIVRQDGAVRWMSGYGRLNDRGLGTPTTMSGVMRDITDRMEMQEELHESGERLKLLIESATDCSIFTTDRDGIVNTWNTGSARIYGWAEDEIIGKDVAVLFTDDDRERGEHLREMEEAARLGRALDERWHKRKDGSTFYASGVTQPLGEAGSQGFVKIARDMTDRMRADRAQREKELMETLVRAQETERRRLARDLHDELGQQLTAMRMMLSRIQKDSPPDLSEKIGVLEQLAEDLDEGVDFLAWELKPAVLDDLGLVPAIRQHVKQWSNYTGVKGEFRAIGLAERRIDPEVETALYRIFQEALNNISKHADAASVGVTFRQRRREAELTVTDDGKGFDAADPETRTRGLGLTGMQERVQLIGGTLEIESKPGGGTKLVIRTPITANLRVSGT